LYYRYRMGRRLTGGICPRGRWGLTAYSISAGGVWPGWPKMGGIWPGAIDQGAFDLDPEWSSPGIGFGSSSFLIFINDLDNAISSRPNVLKFTDDTEVYRVEDNRLDGTQLQNVHTFGSCPMTWRLGGNVRKLTVKPARCWGLSREQYNSRILSFIINKYITPLSCCFSDMLQKKFSPKVSTNFNSFSGRLAHLAVALNPSASYQVMIQKLKSPTISLGTVNFCWI